MHLLQTYLFYTIILIEPSQTHFQESSAKLVNLYYSFLIFAQLHGGAGRSMKSYQFVGNPSLWDGGPRAGRSMKSYQSQFLSTFKRGQDVSKDNTLPLKPLS